MRIFITGATGFIGKNLALKLADSGHTVHALYRKKFRTSGLEHRNIRLFQGSLTDRNSIDKAINSCDQVYHVAAFAGVWLKNPEYIYEQNVQGTKNIMEAARDQEIQKVVFTSTAAVFGPSNHRIISESTDYPERFFTPYEHSKVLAEKDALLYTQEGLHVVIVNPTRVFGPGTLSKSNSITILIDKYIQGKWHFYPGDGNSVGNYVFVEDVVNGHILAMEKGKSGERYLLGGENVSYKQFFEILSAVSGKKCFLMGMPMFIMMTIAGISLFYAKVTSKDPLITPDLVKKYNYNFTVSSDKAKTELGYKPVSLETGFKRTIEWLNQTKTSY